MPTALAAVALAITVVGFPPGGAGGAGAAPPAAPAGSADPGPAPPDTTGPEEASSPDPVVPEPAPEPAIAASRPDGVPAGRPVAAPVITPGVVTGRLEHLWAERAAVTGYSGEDATDPDAAPRRVAPRLMTWLLTAGAGYMIRTGTLDDVPSASTVTLTLGAGTAETGFPVLEVGPVDPPEPAVLDGVVLGSGQTLDFGELPAAVTHQVTAVLAIPAGAARDSTTIESFRATIAGPVAGFWSAQSRGQRSIAVTAAHSWVSLSSSCHADPFTLWNEVAARVGWTGGTRKHLVVYLPPAAGCGAGLGTVGPTSESGGRMWTSHNSPDVIAHEFGHNLGLGHSNGLICPAGQDGAWSGGWAGGCSIRGYGDWYDVMGISWGRLGSLNAAHADRLGLLSSTAKVTVAIPARLRLAPIGSNALRVIRIDDPAGAYYVEYRPAAAQDAWLTGNWRGLDAGVLIRRVNPANTRESLLLDGSLTPNRDADWRAALGPGQSLTTASGRARITVRGVDASGAIVDVAINGQEPAAAPVVPPDGASIAFANPDASTVPAGSALFWGTASAPAGTVLWEVRQGATVRAQGHAAAGANGAFGLFTFAVSLPPGTYTVRAWVPDESSGEAPVGTGVNGAGFSDQVTVTVP